jgi:hypothetical protein
MTFLHIVEWWLIVNLIMFECAIEAVADEDRKPW